MSVTAPRTWVLLDDRPGSSTQSLGLVRALGWDFDTLNLRFGALSRVHPALRGSTILGLDRAASDALSPPWPDLVIAAGDRTATVSRWIRKQSGGRTRIVHLGRRGGARADRFDLVATPHNARLRPHPNRIETQVPLSRVDTAALEDAARCWKSRLDGARSPRIALLVGGATALCRFSGDDAARLGRKVATLARDAGGSVFVSTSRRTGAAPARALADALPGAAWFYDWAQPSGDNPLLAFLALADWIVVTGDSESMLAEACTTDKPVLIYPLAPTGATTWRSRLGEAFVARAQRNRNGWSARAIAGGLILPPRRLDSLHDDLVACGRAAFFGEIPAGGRRTPLREVDGVAQRVRELFEPAYD